MNEATQANLGAAARRFSTYPAYQDCGVEWLGEVPTHWQVRRLRTTIASSQNGVWGDEPDGAHDVVCVRVADFDRTNFRVDVTAPTMRSIDPVVVSARGLRPGDLLLEKSGGGENQPVGAVVLFDHRLMAVCSNFVARIVIAEGHDARYLTYLHAVYYAQRINTRHIKQNTGIQNLDSASYFNEMAALPPATEQRAVAAFLDRETARINTLVARRERLIELLREKRTALITRAVTKGLDPSAATKDSGVEWLEQIPAHWAITRLRNIISLIEQGWSPECENREASDDEWGVLKAGCVNRGIFMEAEHKALPSTVNPIAALEIHKGDLLMSRASGSRDLVGSVAVVGLCRPRLLLCDKVFRLHVDSEAVDKGFLAYAMGSRPVRWQIEIVLSGGSGLANNIAQEVVKDLVLPWPPPAEQRTIAHFLDHETSRIDALVAKIHDSIARLRELRTALISAAVTGKIDVRQEVP